MTEDRTDFNSTEKPEPQPELPDGIGISLEDVAVLLSMKHETSVSRDDPVLMLVTISIVF